MHIVNSDFAIVHLNWNGCLFKRKSSFTQLCFKKYCYKYKLLRNIQVSLKSVGSFNCVLNFDSGNSGRQNLWYTFILNLCLLFYNICILKLVFLFFESAYRIFALFRESLGISYPPFLLFLDFYIFYVKYAIIMLCFNYKFLKHISKCFEKNIKRMEHTAETNTYIQLPKEIQMFFYAEFRKLNCILMNCVYSNAMCFLQRKLTENF